MPEVCDITALDRKSSEIVAICSRRVSQQGECFFNGESDGSIGDCVAKNSISNCKDLYNEALCSSANQILYPNIEGECFFNGESDGSIGDCVAKISISNCKDLYNEALCSSANKMLFSNIDSMSNVSDEESFCVWEKINEEIETKESCMGLGFIDF
jgi:hypothetical protein